MSPQLHIVKIGGKLINDHDALSVFLDVFSNLPGNKILVHGGGRKATELSALLGIETRMVEGRRITNKETLEVAIMVYAGLINKGIVSQLQARGLNGLGICGADANVIKSVKRPIGEIDYGYVGDIQRIDAGILQSFLNSEVVPVICPLSHDGHGQLLNTNADTIAAQVAIAMNKYYEIALSYCFEFDGVLYDVDTPELTISNMSAKDFSDMKGAGSINSGMIPKLSNGFDALKGGIKDVSICGINNLASKERATILTL